MSTLTNIHTQMAASAPKAPTSSFANAQSNAAGSKDKAEGLESFIGALLSQVNNKVSPKPTLASPKTNAVSEKSAADTAKLKETVAKIAEKLNLDPADPASAAKIVEALQKGVAEDDVQLSGLTSDLSAQLSTFLNDSSQTGALDEKLLATLKDALDKFLAAGAVSDEQLAAFTNDLVQQLQTQGIDDKTIAQYMQALKLFPDEPAVASLIPPQVEEVLSGSSKPPVLAQSEVAPHLTDKVAAGKNAIPMQADTAAGTGAPPTTAEAKPAKAEERPVPVAMINEIAGDAAPADTALTKTSDPLQSMMGIKSGDTTNTQGFVNYIQGTGRNISAPTMQMIALQIQQNASNKTSSFTMQLEPADLGRLDISMSFDKSGAMKAHLTADKPETLAMLQRDSHHLNRILQQAGIDVDENALSFDLRDNNPNQDMAGAYSDDSRNSKFSGRGNNALAGDTMMNAQIAVQAMGYITQSGVNIMV